MGTPRRILVVDDEPSIRQFVHMGLALEGYEVVEAATGREALQRFHEDSPHLVVLDRMLPDQDGAQVCERIRSISRVPVLMLTARNELEDRVSGFEHGADDYVGKPVKLPELAARVRALLRRTGSSRVHAGGLELDPATRVVRFQGKEAGLTPRECDVLLALMKDPGEVIERERLLVHLWGFEFDGETNVLEVHVRALRNKLGDSRRTLIRSVRGVGYALRASADE